MLVQEDLGRTEGAYVLESLFHEDNCQNIIPGKKSYKNDKRIIECKHCMTPDAEYQ